MGLAGYPTLRLMTLAETGTRALLGAAVGSAADRDESHLARRLLPLLGPGMLVLLDRAFDANAFLAEVAGTGAMLLARAKATRNPAVVAHLPDGSYLARLDGMTVRMIDADVAMTGADGTRVADRYRLITTLTDHRAFPAAALVRLYHERWEIESAFLALRHTLLDGRVLRSGDRPGIEQELWALLTLYQLLRMAMVTAVETRPGTDPDRASFTSALEAAREELTAARGICPDGPADLPGVIGRAVLATLLPARRLRYSARKVKCATSRYLNRDDGRPTRGHRHHLNRHHHAHPAAQPRQAPPLQPRPAPATAATHPPPADHRDHHRPAPARLDATRTRPNAQRPPPPPRHPAARMVPARLLHPHRARHLPAQHTDTAAILDNPSQTLNYVALDRVATRKRSRRVEWRPETGVRGRRGCHPSSVLNR